MIPTVIHWWTTYNLHHREKLQMEPSSLDPCLFTSSAENPDCGVVGMQTDDTPSLSNDPFLRRENEQLEKAAFTARPKLMFATEDPRTFNGRYPHCWFAGSALGEDIGVKDGPPHSGQATLFAGRRKGPLPTPPSLLIAAPIHQSEAIARSIDLFPTCEILPTLTLSNDDNLTLDQKRNRNKSIILFDGREETYGRPGLPWPIDPGYEANIPSSVSVYAPLFFSYSCNPSESGGLSNCHVGPMSHGRGRNTFSRVNKHNRTIIYIPKITLASPHLTIYSVHCPAVPLPSSAPPLQIVMGTIDTPLLG